MVDHIFDTKAWAAMDVFNQMGNIGSEVGRALAVKKQNKPARMDAAFRRGLDLIDIMVGLWAKQKSPRTRELLAARELFVNSVVTDNVDCTLEDYFNQFAMAARLQR